jgi:molybdopterin-binding protein
MQNLVTICGKTVTMHKLALAAPGQYIGIPSRRVETMPKQLYTAGEAAAALGISLDTLRRWDKSGRIRVERDAGNRRVVSAAEIDRLRGDREGAHISARNRFHAIVTEVKIEGLMAQVEMVVSDPVRLVSIVTRDAVEELGLKKGMAATAIVKSTNVIIQS